MMKQPGGKSPVEELFETRRQFPRLRTNIAALLHGAGGRSQEVRIVDLSPDGAQIRISAHAANSVMSRSTPIDVLKNGKFRLEFRLAPGRSREPVKIGIRPVYLRTVEVEEIAAGVFFDRNDEDALHAIRTFLSDEMQPTVDVLKTSFVTAASEPGLADVAMETEPEESADASALELRHQFGRILSALSQLQLSVRHVEDRLTLIETRLKRRDGSQA